MLEHPSWAELRSNIAKLPVKTEQQILEKKQALLDYEQLEMGRDIAQRMSGKIMGIADTMHFLRHRKGGHIY